MVFTQKGMSFSELLANFPDDTELVLLDTIKE